MVDGEAAGSTAALVGLVGLPFALTLGWRWVHARPQAGGACAACGAAGGCGPPVGPSPLSPKPDKRLRSAWGAAFVLAGVGAHRAVTAPGAPPATRAAAAASYAVLAAAATLAWPPLFAGGAPVGPALADAAALGGAAAAALAAFASADTLAGALLLPLLAWAAFSATLANCVAGGEHPAGVVARAHQLGGVRPRRGRGGAKAGGGCGAVGTGNGFPAAYGLGESNGGCSGGAAGFLAAGGPGPASPRGDVGEGGPSAPVAPLAAAACIGLVPAASGDGQERAVPSDACPATSPSAGSDEPSAPSTACPPLSAAGGDAPATALPHPIPASTSLPPAAFSDPGAAGFRVRGRRYLTDRAKFAPRSTRGRLAAVELVTVASPTQHVARFMPEVRDSAAPLTFVWQVLVPGRQHVSLTVAWALDYDPVARVEAAVAAWRAGGAERGGVGGASPAGAGRGGVGGASPAGPSLAATPAAGASPERPVPWPPAASPYSSAASSRGGETDAGEASEAGDGRGAGDGVQRSARSASAAQAAPNRPVEGHRRAATAWSAALLFGGGGVDGEAGEAGEAAAASTSTPAPLPDWDADAGPAGADPFDLALARFLAAPSDAARHAAFKIIPRIAEGGWVVRQAVGQNTPVLLGRKVTTTYYTGSTATGSAYVEVDVDVGSSRTAASVVGLVQGALKSLVIEIAVLLEGRGAEELPEALLGCVRLEHIDLSAAPARAFGGGG